MRTRLIFGLVKTYFRDQEADDKHQPSHTGEHIAQRASMPNFALGLL
jgi:hypothetical protein